MSPRHLILLLSGLEVLAILPIASFPALLPDFIAAWGLSNTEAGWIAGVYYFGYMLLVTPAVMLTDRIDARLIFITGSAVTGVSTLAFAVFADGFWSGLLLRAIGGAGQAAVYMPGLRALTDRLKGGEQSRAVTFYTASYSIAISLSFTVTGLLAEAYGWRWSFAGIGFGSLIAAGLVWAFLSPQTPPGAKASTGFALRPVLRNRDAMGYIISYAAHGFELTAMRAWVTAFFVFILARDAAQGGYWAASLPSPTVLAAIVTLIGLPASLLGNELALKIGRRRALMLIMGISGAMGVLMGFTAVLPAWVVLLYCAVYFVFICGDSGALTSGMMAAAEPEHRGSTMALHSALGFGISVLGPLCVGFALDQAERAAGGQGVASWGVGLAVMGIGALIGPLALYWAGRRGA
ncbi:MFS transporter [Ferrovibrio sp.]|uniref:MFS transporter n=1 Tax=Ferrovibrio sp. TaxID=1917215 RepID=UPI00260DDD49|nr:MFS transporter [Ferrovibrio sp.]